MECIPVQLLRRVQSSQQKIFFVGLLNEAKNVPGRGLIIMTNFPLLLLEANSWEKHLASPMKKQCLILQVAAGYLLAQHSSIRTFKAVHSFAFQMLGALPNRTEALALYLAKPLIQLFRPKATFGSSCTTCHMQPMIKITEPWLLSHWIPQKSLVWPF